MWLKANHFLFIITDNHTEIWEINESSHMCDYRYVMQK